MKIWWQKEGGLIAEAGNACWDSWWELGCGDEGVYEEQSKFVVHTLELLTNLMGIKDMRMFFSPLVYSDLWLGF